MSRNCSYDCQQEPSDFQPDSDIAGLGVLIAYAASAGIAVLIIVLHFFLAYRPDIDPFVPGDGTASTSSPSFRPNPVDLLVLGSVRRFFRKIKSKSSETVRSGTTLLSERLIKCILLMSDLQIMTGLAILISGYSQLHCRLHFFNWLVVVRLAWFSCVTHLSCLTLLRGYFQNHPKERWWRLFFMFDLVVMLITAIIPTVDYYSFDTYYWSKANSSNSYEYSSIEKNYSIARTDMLSSYTICHFKTSNPDPESIGKSYIALSVLLVGLGFIIRVVRVSPSLSRNAAAQARAFLSQLFRRCLAVLYEWTGNQRLLMSIVGKSIYYPTLALFLALRVLADHCSSIFFEIYWLVVAFSAGLADLISLYYNISAEDRETQNIWSFGQVIALVLLVAPLKTIFDQVHEDRTSAPNPEEVSLHDIQDELYEGLQLLSRSANAPAFAPDQNYYSSTPLISLATIYILVLEIFSGIMIGGNPGFGSTFVSGAMQTPRVWCIFPSLFFILCINILLSLMTGYWRMRRKNSKKRLLVLRLANLGFCWLLSGVMLYALSV